MIVEKSPLYFELEVVYKLLKLHNAMEESNSSQHTKQTYIYIYVYLHLIFMVRIMTIKNKKIIKIFYHKDIKIN